MTTKNLLKNNNGTALFMALLILTGMLVVVLAAADVVTRGIKMSRTQARSTKAYFAAEAGAERILWEVRKNNFNFKRAGGSDCVTEDYINFPASPTSPAVCDSNQHSYPLTNNASYSVVYSSGPPVAFTANGAYLGARRSVEVSY